jgi:hypothetical protein
MPTSASAAMLPMTAPAMRPADGLDGLEGALEGVLELVGDGVVVYDGVVVCGVVLDATRADADARSADSAERSDEVS